MPNKHSIRSLGITRKRSLGITRKRSLGITRKDFFSVFVILFNTFTWWYVSLAVLDTLINDLSTSFMQTLTFWGVYYAAVMGSSIVGLLLSDKIARDHFLVLWMAIGAVASFLPSLTYVTSATVLITCLLGGASFGLGMPSCLAYFADSTILENRGRIGGVILLFTNLSAPAFAVILEVLFQHYNPTITSLVFAFYRGVGALVFLLLKPGEKIVTLTRKPVSFSYIFHDKSFVLYLIPWLMFCFIDRFEDPILKNSFAPNLYQSILIIGPVIGSFFAFLGGLMSDMVGRKRVVLYGFITLGLTYAIIGVGSTIPIAWFFYAILSSVAAGMLMVTLNLTLWGDLSQLGAREKYYLIGSMPFFLTDFVRLLVIPSVTLIPAYAAFSLASFFLFVAVLPLMYAPETLPEKKIELRRLKGYIEQAKKVRDKYLKKSGAEG